MLKKASILYLSRRREGSVSCKQIEKFEFARENVRWMNFLHFSHKKDVCLHPLIPQLILGHQECTDVERHPVELIYVTREPLIWNKTKQWQALWRETRRPGVPTVRASWLVGASAAGLAPLGKWRERVFTKMIFRWLKEQPEMVTDDSNGKWSDY